ncbi:MAG: hypothetical protein ACFB0D_08585 [Phormidesmis sp.]
MSEKDKSGEKTPLKTPHLYEVTEIRKGFFQVQYEQRRREIEDYLNRIEQDQKYGLLVTGVIWSWLAVNYDKFQSFGNFRVVFLILPTVLMWLFFKRCQIMHSTITLNGDHLRKLEEAVGLGSFGWEVWLTNERKATLDKDGIFLGKLPFFKGASRKQSSLDKRGIFLKQMHFTFWRILIGVNLLLPIFFFFANPQEISSHYPYIEMSSHYPYI